MKRQWICSPLRQDVPEVDASFWLGPCLCRNVAVCHDYIMVSQTWQRVTTLYKVSRSVGKEQVEDVVIPGRERHYVFRVGLVLDQ